MDDKLPINGSNYHVIAIGAETVNRKVVLSEMSQEDFDRQICGEKWRGKRRFDCLKSIEFRVTLLWWCHFRFEKCGGNTLFCINLIEFLIDESIKKSKGIKLIF